MILTYGIGIFLQLSCFLRLNLSNFIIVKNSTWFLGCTVFKSICREKVKPVKNKNFCIVTFHCRPWLGLYTISEENYSPLRTLNIPYKNLFGYCNLIAQYHILNCIKLDSLVFGLVFTGILFYLGYLFLGPLKD